MRWPTLASCLKRLGGRRARTSNSQDLSWRPALPDLRSGADPSGAPWLIIGLASNDDAGTIPAAFQVHLDQIGSERVGEAGEKGMVQPADEIAMVVRADSAIASAMIRAASS
jgi:hypothetical protein